MKVITVRLEDTMHKKIKKQLIDDESTLQDYVVMLMNRDMDSRVNNK